jgi:hypothetical protein
MTLILVVARIHIQLLATVRIVIGRFGEISFRRWLLAPPVSGVVACPLLLVVFLALVELKFLVAVVMLLVVSPGFTTLGRGRIFIAIDNLLALERELLLRHRLVTPFAALEMRLRAHLWNREVMVSSNFGVTSQV